MNLSKPHHPAPDTPEHGSGQHSPQLPGHPAFSGAYRRPRIAIRPMAALGWLLLTFILSTGPLQWAVSGQSGRAYFSAAALGGLAVMGGLLVAELRRARAMTMAGIKVDRVELGLLRGRTVSTGEVQSPSDLRRVSWAGPRAMAASAVLLAAAGGLLAIGSSAGLSLLGAAALVSAVAMALLAISDLLPAPGTPGSGLIFARSWRRSGRKETGLVATSRAGVVSGWFLVVAGFLTVALVSFGGLWLILIGTFVIGGSRLMLAGARTREQLAGLHVKDVMSPAPPEVSSFATAELAFTGIALPSRAGVLVVREPDGSFGGIVSAASLAAVPADDRDEIRVRRLAVPPSALATVTAGEPIERVLEQMTAHPAGGLAIVFDEPSGDTDRPHLTVVGVVTASDLAHTVELINAAKGNGHKPSATGSFNPFS